MKWTLRTFLGLLILSIPIYFTWGTTDAIYTYGNILQVIALIFATLACYQAQYTFPRLDLRRRAWGRLAFGSFIWVIAQILEWYCEAILHLIAYGTIADCFWTIGYLILLSGLYLLLRLQSVAMGRQLLMQVVLLIGIFAVLFHSLVLPQLFDPSQRFVEKLLDVAYPTLDFGLFSLSVLLLTRSMADQSSMRSGLAFSTGFALLLYADFVLGAVQDFNSPLYISIDLFYFACYFLMAVAGHARTSTLGLNVQPQGSK